jgi:outer membrane translocation and assembly module TamA
VLVAPLRILAFASAALALCAGMLAGCAAKVTPKARVIDRVDVLGADEIDEEDVKAKIATTDTKRTLGGALEEIPLLDLIDSLTVEYQYFDRFVLQRDLERVRRYYRSRGFYDAQVLAGRVIPLPDHRVRVEIVVEEGLPVLIEEVHVDFPGWQQAFDTNAKLRDIVAKLETKRVAGDEGRPRFDEERYEKTKTALLRALTDDGFAYAEVQGTVRVDLARRAAKVHFTVRAGPPCTFGPIAIDGLDEIPEDPVRGSLGFEEGDPYSTQQLDLAQRALNDLGVFGSVEIAAEPDRAGKGARKPVIPVQVRVRPVQLRSVKLGIGTEIGSQIDLHGIIGWEDRNFLGGLRHFSAEIHPGLVFFPTRAETIFSQPVTNVLPKARLQVDFVQPAFPEARTNTLLSAAFDIYPSRNNAVPSPVPPDYDILGYREFDGALGLDRRSLFAFWGGSTLYLAQFIKLGLSDPFSYTQDSVGPGIAAVIIPYLETEAWWDWRRDKSGKPDAVHTHQGLYFGTDLQLAGGFLHGDADDVRLRPEMRGYVPVSRRVTLGMRLALGFLFPHNYGDALGSTAPTSTLSADEKAVVERDLQLLGFRALFSGGPSSNRGYGYREVGPYFNFAELSPDPLVASDPGQANWMPMGGAGMWELSAEVRFALSKQLGAVVFVDASDVTRTISAFRLTYPHLSPGVGLRIDTPVGPFRFDLGVRVPYLQRVGQRVLEPEEGGPPSGKTDWFPVALSLAIGEAY